MTPEIINGIIQAYGFPAAFAVWLWWQSRGSVAKNDPTKTLFDKLDRIEKKVDQMDQRDDHIHDRLLRLETRDEMRNQ